MPYFEKNMIGEHATFEYFNGDSWEKRSGEIKWANKEMGTALIGTIVFYPANFYAYNNKHIKNFKITKRL